MSTSKKTNYSGLRKKIWIIDHYSSEPQYGGISRQYDFARELDKRGYSVVIFSSGFSHYTHTYISNKEIFVTKPFKHVRYVYVKTKQYNSNNGIDRAFNMISFMTQVIRNERAVAKRYGYPNVVEGVSVHPLAWIAAYIIAKKYKIKFVAEVRDFWPQVWIDSGEKKKSDPMCIFFRKIEDFIYKNADHIIYSLYHGDRYLSGVKGIPKNKITLIGQVMDCERFDQNRKKTELLPRKIQNFIDDGFICCFTGYYMKYNGVFTILEAIKIAQNRGLPIKMVFVGNGEEKQAMQDYVQKNGLRDVLIEDRIDREAIPSLVSRSEICIAQAAHLSNTNVYRFGVSMLKMNEYLYSGACILFGFQFEDNEVIESGAGIQFKPYSSQDLAEKIERVYWMSDDERKRYAENGREQTRKHHDVSVLTGKLIEILFKTT